MNRDAALLAVVEAARELVLGLPKPRSIKHWNTGPRERALALVEALDQLDACEKDLPHGSDMADASGRCWCGVDHHQHDSERGAQ